MSDFITSDQIAKAMDVPMLYFVDAKGNPVFLVRDQGEYLERIGENPLCCVEFVSMQTERVIVVAMVLFLADTNTVYECFVNLRDSFGVAFLKCLEGKKTVFVMFYDENGAWKKSIELKNENAKIAGDFLKKKVYWKNWKNEEFDHAKEIMKNTGYLQSVLRRRKSEIRDLN